MTSFALAILLSPLGQRLEVTGHLSLQSGKDATLAAVWLEGEEKSRPLQKAVIDQRDRAFDPHVMVVTVGTRVEFPNRDNILHNVFAEYNAKSFDLGTYPKGVSRGATFDKAGLVVLQCNMHSEMGAFIVVVDTPYYTIADKKGNFKVSGVPPGKYTLHSWHESNQFFEQDVVISGASKSFQMNLARRKR